VQRSINESGIVDGDASNYGFVMKKVWRYVSLVVDWTVRLTAIALMLFLIVATFTLMLWNRGSP
jgi:hypothetical protein